VFFLINHRYCTMKRIAFLVLPLALLMAGCSDSSASSAGDEPAGPDWMERTGYVNLSDPPGASQTGTPEEGLQDNVDALERVRLAVGGTYSWAEAEANVSRLLDSPEASTNPKVARLAPVALLRTHLLRTDDPAALPVILRYTERLVRDRSPETATVLEGVQRLRGHMPDEDLAELAAAAVVVGEAWAVACDDCEAASTPGPLGGTEEATRMQANARHAEALAGLRGLAASAR
jgi:hypothetical protein